MLLKVLLFRWSSIIQIFPNIIFKEILNLKFCRYSLCNTHSDFTDSSTQPVYTIYVVRSFKHFQLSSLKKSWIKNFRQYSFRFHRFFRFSFQHPATESVTVNKTDSILKIFKETLSTPQIPDSEFFEYSFLSSLNFYLLNTSSKRLIHLSCSWTKEKTAQ